MAAVFRAAGFRIHRLGPWKAIAAVEWETLKWVDWFNNRRLLGPIGYIPPAEAEERYYAQFDTLDTSQNNRDAWFVGFSEHGITTGVWVGPTDDGFMRGVSGGNVPSQIFREFNQNLYERYELCGPNFMLQSSGYGRDINC